MLAEWLAAMFLPDLWEEGINAGLLNYSFNGNSINNRSNHNAGKSKLCIFEFTEWHQHW